MTTQNTQTAAESSHGFEFFEGSHSEAASRPQITVRRGGLIVLTPAAVEMLGSDDVAFVQLGFNAKTGEVGLRAADEEAHGRYRLRTQKKGRARLIGGKRFFNYYRLSIDKARTYDVKEYGKGLIGFRLSEAADQAEPEPEATAKPAKSTKTTRRRKAAA